MTCNLLPPIRYWVRKNYQWVLIASCIPLFSTKALFNLPLIIMAIGGLVYWRQDPGIFRTDSRLRIMGILFLCLWLPLLLSLFDAVNIKHSSSTVVRYLGLFLVGIFIIQGCKLERVRQRIYYSIVIMVSLMCVDGIMQYMMGYNIFAYPLVGGRVTGIFFPKLHIGLLLSVLSPVLFKFTLENVRQTKFVLLLPLLLMAMLLLSGNRVSWMIFCLSAIGFAGYLYVHSKFKLRTLLIVIAVMTIVLVLVYRAPFVQQRLNATAGLFSTDFKSIDNATSYRLSIWKVGMKAYQANPVNGIGPRGFRYVYKKYADKGNVFLNPKLKNQGMTHPHLMVLEVAVETGTIGLIGYFLFFVFLIRFYKRENDSSRHSMFPLLLSALVAVFPFNAHMAWYGSYWGAVSWWLLMLAIGFAQVKKSEE